MDGLGQARFLLNADMGEGEPNVDARLMPYLDLANLACGGHAGNASTMKEGLLLAKTHGVAAGIHFSYPDPGGFGRRRLNLPLESLKDAVRRQMMALLEVAHLIGVEVRHGKAHGALYHDQFEIPGFWPFLLDEFALLGTKRALVVPAGRVSPKAQEMASDAGVLLLREVFADRRYQPDASLLDRRDPDALIHSSAAIVAQAEILCHDSRVMLGEGGYLPLQWDTLCLHGDHPPSVNAAAGVAAVVRHAKRKD
jgi:UPF0271 protein